MSQAAADNTWADLMAEGRLPRFALICLGVWLNAADSLVTATILPSVGADLGGYAYFSWATAGFFVGAILANVVFTELVILVFCFFFLLVIGANYESVLAVLFVVALIFPVAFYHHSWSLWLGFDYLVESLPKYRQYRSPS